jgi:hypothetical protein
MSKCELCRSPVDAGLTVCPFCGHDRIVPIELEANKIHALSTAAELARKQAAERAPAESAVAACPLCGGRAGDEPLPVEHLKRVPSLQLYGKYETLSFNMPGPCPPCARWLKNCRRWAVVLELMPFLLAFPFNGQFTKFNLFIIGAAVIGLFRAGSYGWADRLLYGNGLEEQAAAWMPRRVADGYFRLPGGITYALARLACAAALGMTLASSASFIKTMSQPTVADAVSQLSKVQTLYIRIMNDGQTPYYAHRYNVRRETVAFLMVSSVKPEIVKAGSPREVLKAAIDDPHADGIEIEFSAMGENLSLFKSDIALVLEKLPPDPAR